MKVSQTIAVSVSSVLFLGMMTLSTGLALARSGGGGEVRLIAKMMTNAASGKADYRERGNRKRLNVEAEDLPLGTQTSQTVFVNNVQVGIMLLEPCPVATLLLCGELELNTQDGQSVPTGIAAGQSVKIGDVLSGTLGLK
jgi:hypothetical protein